MKKSELVIGREYAYSTTREELPRWFTKAKLVSLESEKGYRAKANTVLVEFTHTYGSNPEPITKLQYVQLYTLKGDYETIKNKREVLDMGLQIQQLKNELEKNRRVNVMNQYKKNFIDFGISAYSFRDYRPSFQVEFTEEQFKTVSKLLATYNKDLAEEKALHEQKVNA